MKRLLVWDTSSKAGSIAALQWNEQSTPALVSEWSLNVSAAQHSERLLWGIHQTLEASGWKLEDVDCFGVGIGPGSFTGLRIGVTTARTLASAMGKPLIGISSLAALARPMALHFSSDPTLEKTVIIACTDAAKGELFTLVGTAKSIRDCVVLSDGDRPGLWKRGVEEDVLTPEEIGKAVLKRLKDSADTRWIRIGEGRNRYPDLWKSLPAQREVESPFPWADHVQGRYVGILCWEAYQAGILREPLQVHPRYLRESDAERNLKAGKLPKGPTRGNP